MLVAPVKVLAPERTRVPAPSFRNVPAAGRHAREGQRRSGILDVDCAGRQKLETAIGRRRGARVFQAARVEDQIG